MNVGAAINMAFITHFQKVSEGHFVIRDLERRYGIAPVQAAYESLKAEMQSERAASAERFSWWPERPAGEPAAAQSTGQEAPEPEPELGPEPELEPERELELEPEPDVAATSPGPGVEEAVPPPARPDLAWLLEARRHLKIAQHDPGHIILRFSPAILGCVPQLAGGDAEALWRGVKGIEAMRINVWKRSIVLDYDPSVIATSVWSDLLEGDDPVARQRLFDLVH